LKTLTVESQSAGQSSSPLNVVTFRAFVWGLLLCMIVAALNSWLPTAYQVHMVGGIQMPFVPIFILLLMVVVVNLGLRALQKGGWLRPFSVVELMTLYGMMLFGGLISTPGCDNVFLTTGSTLFYFSSPENKWANLFYQHVPSWFAPGWNGVRFQHDVIDPLYLGGLSFSQIPWHAWAVMLIAWSVFLGFCYSVLFFTALIFRKQWISHEALAFPLVEVPLQMVERGDGETHPPAAEFWGNKLMWLGFGIAFVIHIFKGMNSIYPDWPVFPVNAFGSISIAFTERPWNVIPSMKAELFLGGIGIAYLLTREISFSFWFFFLFFAFEYALAEMLGFPVVGMTKPGAVNFILDQSTGGWIMMALLLIWTAREYIMRLLGDAWKGGAGPQDEPFSPRFMILGFLLSFAGLLGWSWFAGINVLIALVFFAMFILTSLVLSRMVIEGGFMFPQAPYQTLNVMMGSAVSYQAIGASTLTKLSFIQPMILSDMRTNVLPAFLSMMKIAHEIGLDKRQLRRLLLCCVVAIIATLAVTIVVSVASLYSNGGLQSYSFFASGSATTSFKNAASAINGNYPWHWQNLAWMAFGALMVLMMMTLRSRLLWFPLHPLGYLVAPGYAIKRLWFSFFLGWLIKSLVMKYGGSDAYRNLRPFMIGLILGNVVAMVFWVLIGFYTGSQTPYWPA